MQIKEKSPKETNVSDAKTFFLGQNPNPVPRHERRVKKPIYLKQSCFAYDLWEFKYNTNLRKYEVAGLYYQGMRELINSMNYYKRPLSEKSHIYIKEDVNIIREVTIHDINDELRAYVDSIKDPISFEYSGENYSIPSETLQNIYLKQHHNIINDKWLTNIQTHDKPILKDTKECSYFVFRNGFATITKAGSELKPFSELDGRCVWEAQVINHSFVKNEAVGIFEQFINNVCNHDSERILSMRTAIGYLLHTHFNPTKGQAVLLYDEALTDTTAPQGGTGKGLIVQAIKQLVHTAKIDGKNYKSDDKFKFSNVTPSTQLVWIDETNKNFDFRDLFSCMTDGWQVERKFQNKFDIAPADSPKVVICSNTIIENKGSSNKRRQFILELSDYYSRQIITGTEEPIKEEHGILFSDEWSRKEWNIFYSYMLECSKLYLSEGLCNYQRKNVELNLLKQQTCDEFMEYITLTPPPLETEISMKDLFNEFKNSYLGEDSKTTQRTFVNWLKKYCASQSYEFKNVRASNGNRFYQISAQVH